MSQIALHQSPVIQHLLWHKAVAEFDEDPRRFNDLIEVVQEDGQGEYLSQKGVLREVALTLELVTRAGLDPWDLDLVKFSELFLREAQERGIDLVAGGRILLMAWQILRLQSDEIATRAVEVPELEDEPEFGWDDIPDFGFEEDDWDYTQRIQTLETAPIDEKIRHKGSRRVTLMELIGAFEEVHRESEERQQKMEAQAKARVTVGRSMRTRVGSMMHTEDLQAEIQETLARISDYGHEVVPFSSIHSGFKVDLVQCFTGVLFLAKMGKIEVAQPEFPHGEIYLQLRPQEDGESAPDVPEEVLA